MAKSNAELVNEIEQSGLLEKIDDYISISFKIVDKSKPLIDIPLYISKEILKDSAILVVDLEPQYIETRDDYFAFKPQFIDDAMHEASKRAKEVSQNISFLKDNYPVYTTGQKDLYPELTQFTRLPDWNCLKKSTKKAKKDWAVFTDTFKSYKYVMVCGLWMGRCVMDVHDYLRDLGVKAVVLDDPRYTLAESLIGDPMPLRILRKCIDV